MDNHAMIDPNIVFLDSATINPGDLSWSTLEEMGKVTIYPYTPPDAVLSRLADANMVITNKTWLGEAEFAQLPHIQYIGLASTGTDAIDVEAARRHGITVTHIPNYSTEPTAQMMFALLYELTRRVGHHNDAVHAGRWNTHFCFWDYPQHDLTKLTLGIVGFGNIGRAVARIANGIGMPMIAHTRTEKPHPQYKEFRWGSLQELLECADVVSLHLSLNDSTQELINARTLAMMKPSAFLVNVSRGALINQHDLADALESGTISGAALDVLSPEPPAPDNPLLHARNCIITPHIAWTPKETRARLIDYIVENVREYLRGTPKNMVMPK